MASAKTLAIQSPGLSSAARQRPLVALTADERRATLALPAGQRHVLDTWTSTDGRTIYAYDGISVRRMNAVKG